jgi:hypothetical protein
MCKSKEFKNYQEFVKEAMESNLDPKTREKYEYGLLKDNYDVLLKDLYKNSEIFRFVIDSWYAKNEYVICGNGYNRNDKFYYRYGTLVQDNSSFEEGIDTIENIFKKYSINEQMIEMARRVNYTPRRYLIPIKDPHGQRDLNEVGIDDELGDFIFWDDERKRRGDYAIELFLSEVKENTNK